MSARVRFCTATVLALTGVTTATAEVASRPGTGPEAIRSGHVRALAAPSGDSGPLKENVWW
jgi:hypothetical protein